MTVPAFSTRERGYKGLTDEWLTPPEIVNALGPFDTDPCCPTVRPWDTATLLHYHEAQDGLSRPWVGFVWCNPPYGPRTAPWLVAMAEHNNGIALTYARTETKMFFASVWGAATSIFFFKGRLKFYTPEGELAPVVAAAPSVLIGYGELAYERIEQSGIKGAHLRLPR